MTDSQNIAQQTAQEIATMRKMIALYCRGNHKAPKGEMCPECSELFEYALARIERCPVKDSKSFCSACTIHCYRPEMRERIRVVMRYSGPRMLLHDPVMAIRHLITTRKQQAS